MPVNSAADILKIHTEADLNNAIQEFSDVIDNSLQPLNEALRKQLLTPAVQQLELHMTFVESWRDRVARTLMLATILLNHGKGHRFLLAGGKNVTSTDREAYMKQLVCAAIGYVDYLAETLKSIDSRVNSCKILLRSEVESGKNSRFV